MKVPVIKAVRCAIYTRVSTDHGLDQEFNSLDAQYDAASAYIKSQAHAGWTLISGSFTDAEQIASREKCSVRHVNMTISLAFLAPKLVRAAIEGRLPRGINIERLRDAPAEWSRQFEALGLNPQQ
jgi:hypothetical protein